MHLALILHLSITFAEILPGYNVGGHCNIGERMQRETFIHVGLAITIVGLMFLPSLLFGLACLAGNCSYFNCEHQSLCQVAQVGWLSLCLFTEILVAHLASRKPINDYRDA